MSAYVVAVLVAITFGAALSFLGAPLDAALAVGGWAGLVVVAMAR